MNEYLKAVANVETMRWSGRVREVAGLLVASDGPAAGAGDFCEIQTGGGKVVRAQVVGFRDGRILMMPLDNTGGIQLGDTVVARAEGSSVEVSEQLLGRVLDGFGRPADAGPPVMSGTRYDLYAVPPGPLERAHIDEPLITGTRAVDSLLPIGKGQRVGIFGGSGVGKSTLLGSMVRNSSADVSVIALIGERNREVGEFLDKELGESGLRRSVVVVATSDQPAPLRIRAGFVALAIAEFFRDSGKSVLLVMDSVTRLAMAQREIGLAAGEPPGQKGYPPSVFALLPKIFERAGNFPQASITGFFTVLVEGDDFNEPICDAVRAILDGHIVLSRQLGAMGHYPAIDILNSVSRLAQRVASVEHNEAARRIREAMATYQQSEDLINLGAYVAGSNPRLDRAIKLRHPLLEFLRQPGQLAESVESTLHHLHELAKET